MSGLLSTFCGQGCASAWNLRTLCLLLGVGVNSLALGKTVTLKWDPGTDESIVGYRLYRGSQRGNYNWTANVPAGNSAPVTGLVGGQTYFFTATALNRDGIESERAVEIKYVAPPNHAPVLAQQMFQVREGRLGSFTIAATDADRDPITFTVGTPPRRGSLTGIFPNVTYNPNPGFQGTDTFTLTATDGVLSSKTVTIFVVVVPDQAPVAVSQSLVTSSGTPVQIQVSASDAEGDPLYYWISASPVAGTLYGHLPNVSYTPKKGFSGQDSFSFVASDGVKSSSVATVTITVSGIKVAGVAKRIPVSSNPPPVAIGQNLTVSANSFLPLALAGTDADGDPLSFSIQKAPASGILSGVPSDLIYRPFIGFVGTDVIEFAAADGRNVSTPASVTIQVSEANPADTSNLLETVGIAPTETEVGAISDAPEWTLEVTSGKSPQGDLFLSFTAIPTADYEVQIFNPNRIGVGPGWEPYTWGIKGVSGTLSIPVGASLAGRQFQVVSHRGPNTRSSGPIEVR